MTSPSVWLLAAKHLAGEKLDDEAVARAGALLAKLGVADLTDADRRDLVRLFTVASRLDRIFALQSPTMPGLHFFGAEVSPTIFGARWGRPRGVSGAGPRPIDALRRCLGEAVEYISQHDFGLVAFGPLGQSSPPAPWLERLLAMAKVPENDQAPIDHCPGRLLPGESRIAVPADACWRRPPEARQVEFRFAPGLGCAAGVTTGAAATAAILELVERDALALWWRGGRRGRPVPAELIASAGAGAMLAHARAGGDPRQTWFLDLGTEIGVPVMAALSVDAEGRDFAFGVAAAWHPEQALTAACLQLGQLELADCVVAAKLSERGEAGLNDIDRMHRRRAALVTADWAILHPLGAPLPVPPEPDDSEGVEPLVERLAAHGHDVVLVDQTQPEIGVPVMRALIPSLQPDPGDCATDRLAAALTAFGDAGAGGRPAII